MKICIVTGSRADYGLLEPLIRKIYHDDFFNFRLVATGSHLSPEFGMTVDNIMFPYDKIECILSSDTPVGISKSMGLGLISFGEYYESIKPDMVLLLGDRHEILMAACAAHVARIPIGHIHGGEVTSGAYDDAFRHSITKMSQLHFVATEPYAKRVIQLGENPETVYNVGALGCEGLEKRKEFPNNHRTIIILHPETVGSHIKKSELLDILDDLCFDFIDISGGYDAEYFDYRGHFPGSHRQLFLDSLKEVDFIIGNSSSGIIEAPALGVPTINIGDRQKGRLMADSIIQAKPTIASIENAIWKLYSKDFQALLKTDYYQPYKGENVSGKIIQIIKDKFSRIEMKKGFYDLPFCNAC